MRDSKRLPSPVLLVLLLLPALGSSCANGDPDDFDQDGVVDGQDCDPEDATIYPGANDPIGDQIDQNCDGVDGVDSDGDGFGAGGGENDDCNDNDAAVNPMADDPEGDGIDQNCDGVDGITDPGDDDDATSEYACGWPVWSGADSLGSPGFGGSAAVGEQLPRLYGVDQCGEDVDLYHLGGGPPIIISVYAMWSSPDRSMASWLAGSGGTPYYDEVREAVESGDLRWVSLLMQDNSFDPADADDGLVWAEDYPTDNVPVLTGPDVERLYLWFGSIYVPYLVFVDGNMEVLTFGGGEVDPLDAALNYLNER